MSHPSVADEPVVYHGYLDCFSILSRTLYVEGWANHFDPALFYDGEPLSFLCQKVIRPELVAGMGHGADNWGFVLTALLPTEKIDHTKFCFTFNAGISLDNPSSHFSEFTDQAFRAMEHRFCQEVANKKGSLLEIGSRARSGASYRSWFPADIDYVGMDITAGPNVDVIADAHHLTLEIHRTFDFIFSIAVFEHILMPWKVALEMNRVLNDGGIALIISHAAWPLHEEPWDFWRYSKDAWKGLFNKHTGFEVIEAQYQFPAKIVPKYIHDPNFEKMSLGNTFLISGCLIRKIGAPSVEWSANVAEIYNLAYDHA